MEALPGILKILGTLALTTFFNKILSTFRIRQLYLSFENVLECYDPGVKGYTVLLAVYNKGKDKEKNVEIIIPGTRKCQVLSSDYPSITCVENVIKIDRVIPKQIVNIAVFVEGDDRVSKKNKPKIKSEDANGKSYSSKSEVPPSMGPSLLFASGCLAFLLLISYTVWAGKDPFNMYYAIKYSEYVEQGLSPWGAGDNYMISTGSSAVMAIETLPVSRSGNKIALSYRVRNTTNKPIYVSLITTSDSDFYREISSISRNEPKSLAEKKKAEIEARYWKVEKYEPDSSIGETLMLPGQEKIFMVKKEKPEGADPEKLELLLSIEGETDEGQSFNDMYRYVPAKSKNAQVFLDLVK